MSSEIVAADSERPGSVNQPEGILLQFGNAAPAQFRLLWDDAPRTCRAVADNAPSQGECVHAIYSGTVVGFFLDPAVSPPLENATSIVVPGDLLFTHYDERTRHGYPDPLSEIYWPYDRYARPTIPGQFVPTLASVFATFDGNDTDWGEFAERSRATRYHGGEVIHVRLY
jgi:hypothetical protein